MVLVEKVALVEGLGVDRRTRRNHDPSSPEAGDLGTWGSFGASNVNEPAAVERQGSSQVRLQYLQTART